MTARRARFVGHALALCCACALSGEAWAQTTAPHRARKPAPVIAFEHLPAAVSPGERVRVLDDAGRKITGRVASVSATELHLRLSDEWSDEEVFTAEHVVSVTRIDSRVEGTVAGFALGALPGIAIGVAFDTYCNNEYSRHCPFAAAVPGLVLGGLGALLGNLIDGAIDGDVAFARPRRSGDSRVSITPFVTSRAKGVALSFQF